MSPARVRAGEWLAGAAGALLLVALFLDWYERTAVPAARGSTAYAPMSSALTAWQAFSATDVLLALLALSGLALLAVQLTRRSPALPTAMSVVTVTCGIVAVLLVLVRLIAQPGDNAAVEIAPGAWLALLGALGLLAGGWWSLATERSPGAPVPRTAVRRAPPAGA